MATTVTYKGSTLTTATNEVKILKTAGKYMEDDVTIEDVDGSTPINNQNKTVTPSTTQQSVTYDNGYTGLGTVTVQAMPSGTAGTPTAAKSAVSNHTITITPSVTNSAGYISNGTKTGTAVTVSAGEVVSGTLNITTNGTKDVTNYASVSVNVSGGGSTLQTKNYTVSAAGSDTITPDSGYDGMSQVNVTVPSAVQFAGFTEEFITQNNERKWKLNSRTIVDPEEGGHAGWLDEGIYDGIPLTYNAVASGTTITPTESSQTIGGYRYMMEGAVTVAAISSSYVGSNITRRTSSDLTASGATVTVPSGFYQSSATKTITNGSVTAPSTISGTTATVTTGTNTLTLTKTVSVTPNVTTAGYISSGTAGNASVSLTASVTTKAAATITPGTTNQTIASGTYLTGTQTISGDANLVGSNILSGKSIFGVAGTVTFQTYYTGSTTPAASLGSNGDIYLQS